jgi:orotate phosphoribosyltransferase
MNDLVSYLFETKAFKVCPDNKPFWYTSGKIGPYFINTQFLYGSEQDSIDLLSFIDEEKSNKLDLPKKIFDKVLKQYKENDIYKDVIDEMIRNISDNIDVNEIDYISGGERRDWFFSNIIAYLLNKPHITLFKDLSSVVSNSDFSETKTVKGLRKAKVLHIADLVTEASSFVRFWCPAIESLNANIIWSEFVVDRMQGGAQVLKDLKVKPYSLVQIDTSLFEEAKQMGLINETQKKMLDDFYKNPDRTMRDFLIAHPEFIEEAKKATDPKTPGRVKTLLEKDLYNLNS